MGVLIRRGLSQEEEEEAEVGGARNLINNMVREYWPRSGWASLEGWEGHEIL